jgi:hypothetical protein
VIVPRKHGKVGHDHVDHIAPGQRQRAGGDELGAAVFGSVFHHHDDPLHPGDQIHRPAHALDHLARHHPVGDVAVFGDFHRAQHGQVDMPAADHRKAGGAVEIGGIGQFADRLLARVDQIGIDFVVKRKRPDAQHAVFRLQRDLHPGGDMVGHERRDADAQVHIEPVLQFARGAGGHFVAGPGHHAVSVSRVVRNSIFLS